MDKSQKTNLEIMQKILQGWNFMRILRLVMGIIIIIQGINGGQALYIIIGILFSGMSLANIGCCGTTGCDVKHVTSIKNKSKDINYEELDPVK